MRALWYHFILTLQINYKSWKPILYGYLIPVLFLIGFGSVFRTGQPRLLEQMGQILTITILGSTALGMATALVAERERGLWRRFQLLPVPTNRLLVSVMLVRFFIVLLAVVLQLILANLIYKTPFPYHLWMFLLFIPVVIFAFLGVGIIIAAVAKEVPSVQAIGQCVFLPMILIGGVGIPFSNLPSWGKLVASFMPGRYSVDLIQSCYHLSSINFHSVLFPFTALILIGITSLITGLKLMRWDQHQSLSAKSGKWILLASMGWIITGTTAVITDRTQSSTINIEGLSASIDAAFFDQISFEILPEDDGFYAPLAPPLNGTRLTFRMQELQPRLSIWAPASMDDPLQSTLNLLSLAAIADILQDHSEAVIARMVFDQLKSRFSAEELKDILARVIVDPRIGKIMTAAPELGFSTQVDSDIIRERCDWYARKFLGRLLGKIPENS